MRFSDFLLVSDPGDLDFIVGYTEEQNIRISVSDIFGGYIKGSGNAGYVPVFTSNDSIGNSQIFQDGSNIVIGGVNAMGYRLAVGGTIYAVNGAVIETTALGADALRVISEGENIFIIPNELGISIFSSRRIIHPPAILTTESATLGQLNTAISNLEGDVEILLDLKVDKSSVGEPNGVASLDATGKIPLSEIPDSIIGQVEYMGTWNAFTNTPTLNPLVPEQKGHYYVVSAAGVFGGVDYAIGDWIISNGVEWQKVDNTDAVTSVFGRIGAILAIESDYQSFYPRLSQAYDNPTWINSLAFTKITNVPPFLLENQTITLSGDVTGSGKTSISTTISNNAVSNEKLRDSLGTSVIGRTDNSTGDPADIQATTDGQVLLRSAGNLLFGLISSDSISSIDWSKITGTPTTLGGYGITDAYTKVESDNKFVPYTGANANVNLGSNNINANSFIKAGGTSSQFLKADGSVDTSQYVPTTRSINAGTGLTGGGNLSSDVTISFDTTWGDTRYAYRTRQLTINGTTYDLSADRTWIVGTVNNLTTIGTSGPATLVGDTLNIPNYTTDLSGYVTLGTDQTITGLKTILRGGDVLNFKIGTDTLYGLKVAYNQNELVPSGEATWSFVNTFNRDGSGFSVTPLSFFRGVLVTGERLLSASINSNLLDYYGNNPTGRYPVYAYNTGVQQFSESILVGYNTGLVNAVTGSIASLPSGVVANFNGRVIGSNAVNSNEFVTLSQITGGFVPYTGANQTVNLNTQQLQAGHATFTTNGSTDTLTINHTSGSGRGIIVTKSGSGEGLTVVKSSGSGNVASITGGITLISELNLTNALADTYIASAANWNTAYNNRITSLTTTGTSGAATLVSHVLNIPQYQAQGNYITSLTGEATASGPGAASVTLTNSAVTGKVLTGLTVTGSSISSTDSILTAFGKLQGQVNDLVGGLKYDGTWNASTNTPTITSGVGTDGEFYIVSVAGTTNVDGINDWQVGDWIVFHDTAWQKVDNTESVVSVNGFVGAVTLTTSNITEGTNLYFTDARSRTAISLTTTGNSGASTYNNTTGVFNIPQYTLTGLGGVPTTRSLTINGNNFDLSADRSWTVGDVRTDSSYSNPSWITSLAWSKIIGAPTFLTSVTASSPLFSSGGATPNITIQQASGSQSGFLSSTDWTTFNNKIGYTGFGGSTNTIPKFTGSTSIGNSLLTDDGSTLSYPGSLVMGTAGTSYIRMGRFPSGVTNTGEAWIGRASDRNVGTMTVQLGGNSPSSRNFEVVDYAWSIVLFNANSDGNVYAASSFRAPIFYDNNNTAYYGDFASTSRINTIQIDTLRGPQGDWLLGYQSGTTYSFGSTAVSDTLNIDFTNMVFNPGTGNLGNRYFRLNKGASNDGGILLSRDNAIDWQIINSTGTGDLAFYGYGSGTNVLTLSRSGGIATAPGSMRSPIFYDSDNTGFYLDPASTSNILQLRTGSGNSSPASTPFSNTLAGVGTNRVVNFDGNGSTPSVWWTNGGRAYAAIDAQDPGMTFWANNGSSWQQQMAVNYGNITINTDIRSPIFYDSNNTGFYLDPNGTSVITSLFLNGTVTVNSGNAQFWQSANGAYQRVDSRNEGSAARSHWYGVLTDGSTSNFRHSWYDGSAYFDIAATGGFINFTRSGGGSITTDGSFRAPIFFDSDNTNYYINPAGTTSLRTVGSWRADSSDWDGEFNGKIQYHSTNWYFQAAGSWLFRNSGGTNVFSVGQSGRVFYSNYLVSTNSGGLMGDYDVAGTTTKVIWTIGESWPLANMYGLAYEYGSGYGHHLALKNNGTTYSRIGFAGDAFIGGTTTAGGDFRAPIFYDSNNTGYYIDPASTSSLYSLVLSGATYFRPNSWIQFDGSYGLYWPSSYGAHLHANDLSSYTQIALRGSKNSYGGIHDSYSGVTGFMYDGSGNGGAYRESNGRWYFYYNLSTDCMGIGTSSTSSGYSLYLNKGVYAQSRIDATIFYDTNDTFYFVDPNSTSRLSTVTAYGEYGSYRNDTQSILRSYNTSAGSPLQFYLDHSYGNVSIGNNRGAVLAGGDYWQFNNSARAPIFYDSNNTNYYAAPSGTSRFVNLLLGGASATGFTLNIDGNAQIVRSSTSTALIVGLHAVTGSVIRFSYNGGFVGSISTDGSNTSYNTSSDYRLKEDLKPIDNPLEKVLNLNPLNFKYKSSGIRQDGFIAHELQEILPYIVTGEKDAVDEFGDPVYQEVDYSKLTPILIAAIKELKKEIDTLKAN
jgi:hypothetical protein